MKHFESYIKIKTQAGLFADFTKQLCEIVGHSGISSGLCILCAPDGGCGIALTSAMDPKGLCDAMDELRRCAPARVDRNDTTTPFEIAGHIRAALTASSVPLAVADGKLVLGAAQSVVLLNFYGPAEREVRIDVFERSCCAREQISLRTEFLGAADITNEINNIAARSGVRRGLCHVAVRHTTAGIALLDMNVEPRLLSEALENTVPTRADFKHRETAYDASGHIKAAVAGCSLLLPVSQGRVAFPGNTRAVFTEFDGPRKRSMTVSIFNTGE